MNKHALSTKILKTTKALFSSSNRKTVAAYDKHAKEYIRHTYQDIDMYAPEMREWIDASLLNIKPEGTIFEIGSATLRDAAYMRQQGFNVVCSDAAQKFVSLMQEQGEKALLFNVLEDKFPASYDMIFANGVLSHFTPQEITAVLDNIYEHLDENGIFAFSIKYGTGEEWITEKFNDGRFTHYWKLEEIFDLLQESGFSIVFENNNRGSFPSHRWLNIVCRKM
jgi:SAM-dependent methyltransferase